MYKSNDSSNEPYEVKGNVEKYDEEVEDFLVDSGFEIDSSNNLIVYHGSGVKVDRPSYDYKVCVDLKCEADRMLRPMDLGNGFYLDGQLHSTIDWGLLYSADVNREFGKCIVNKYTLTPTGLTFKILRVENEDDVKTYLACLCYYHGNIKYDDNSLLKKYIDKYGDPDIFNYDVIIAPRLDSKYNEIVRDFIKENIGFDFFVKIFKESNIGYQVYLQSENAYNNLRFLHTIDIIDVEKTSEIISSMEQIKMQYIEEMVSAEESFRYSRILSEMA